MRLLAGRCCSLGVAPSLPISADPTRHHPRVRTDAGALGSRCPGAGDLGGDWPSLLLIVPAVFGSYRGRAGRAVRDIVGWTAIASCWLAGYSYRDELGQHRLSDRRRIRAARHRRGRASPAGEGSARCASAGVATAISSRRVTVNGASVTMLVDTGASTVVLRQPDAKQLGIDIAAPEVHGAGPDRQRRRLCGACAPPTGRRSVDHRSPASMRWSPSPAC